MKRKTGKMVKALNKRCYPANLLNPKEQWYDGIVGYGNPMKEANYTVLANTKEVAQEKILHLHQQRHGVMFSSAWLRPVAHFGHLIKKGKTHDKEQR